MWKQGSSGPFPVAPPLFRCDFPYFRRQTARNVIAVFPADDAHALLFRYSSRGGIGNGLGNTQHRKFEHFKPIVSYRVTSLGHQPLAVPGQAQPETAIVGFTTEEADRSDQLVRDRFQAKRPGPFVSPRDSGQCDVTIKLESAIGWIRPRHSVSDIANNLPMRKQNLSLLGVRQFQRTQDQPGCFQDWNH